MDVFGFNYVQQPETRTVAFRLLGYFINAGFSVTPKKSDAVRAAELRDENEEYLFAISPARGHLNIYLRGPAARRSSELVADAEHAFSDIAHRNPSGETILRVETSNHATRLIEWLDRALPWPK